MSKKSVSIKLLTTLVLAQAMVGTAFAVSTVAAQTPQPQATTSTPKKAPKIATATATATTTTEAPKPVIAKSAFYLGLGANLAGRQGFLGLMPKISAGYGYLFGKCKQYYLGTEVFSSIWTIPLSPNQYYRITNLYGASILPGYFTTSNNLYFLRLGVENVRYTNFGTKAGALFGIGFQANATGNWDLRGEYDYGTNKNVNLLGLDLIYHFY